MSAIVVEARRVRDRRPVTKDIVAVYQDDGRDELHRLFLFSDWSARKGDWRKRDEYRIEEVPTPSGRGFMLHRSADAIAKDGPDADPFYGVLVAQNGQDHQCTCRGFQAHCRCKHHDAVRELLEAGHIDDPEAGRPTCARCGASVSDTPLVDDLCEICRSIVAPF